jgi:hypothetical protein
MPRPASLPETSASLPATSGSVVETSWQVDVDPDELEYLVHAIFSLDIELSDEGGQVEGPGAPTEGRTFHLVLVRALLHALETESPSRAEFVDQLRSSWPAAAEAC